jgi:hypothetical protein
VLTQQVVGAAAGHVGIGVARVQPHRLVTVGKRLVELLQPYVHRRARQAQTRIGGIVIDGQRVVGQRAFVVPEALADGATDPGWRGDRSEEARSRR